MNLPNLLSVSTILVLALAGLYVALAFVDSRRRPAKSPVADSVDLLLSDSRSCFQAALRVFGEAIAPNASDESVSTARRVLRLVQNAPAVVLSEVIRDRQFAEVEGSPSHRTIWIVSSDDSIEFQYSDLDRLFSRAVIDNLQRGTDYRYLVPHTKRALERLPLVHRVIDQQRISTDKFQVRLFSLDYWNDLRAEIDEYIVFQEHDDSISAFYRFPAKDEPETGWVEVPSPDAKARLIDAMAMWESAVIAREDLPQVQS